MSDLSKLVERLEREFGVQSYAHNFRVANLLSEAATALRTQAMAGQQDASPRKDEGGAVDADSLRVESVTSPFTAPACPAPSPGAVTREMLQVGFNIIMGEEPNTKDGWWGTSDQVEVVEAIYRAMRPLDPYVAALERDARRYRHMRNDMGDKNLISLLEAGAAYWDAIIDRALNAAIDQARGGSDDPASAS